MVSATLQYSHGDVRVPWDLMEEAAGTPWIEVTICEHYIGCVQEILAGITATKGV